jgi:tetratricopeptide (TPR) repeat protein
MVDKELQPAKSLVDSGWQQARQPELWRTTLEDATQKLKQAELVVATREATPELIDQVGAVRRELDKALQALQLAVEIDGCLAGILAGHQNYAEAAKSLPAIFNRAGIDVLGSDSDRIADWVKHHPVSDSLVVILAAWSFWETDSEITKRLGNILLKIDPSRIFAGMQWLIALRMKNTAQLERLAQSPDAMIMPPKALVLMGIALRWSGDSDAAVRMLRRWQALYPDEFWLNLQLGHELLGLKEPRPREAISYMLVAVALRKEYSRSHFGLASAYDAAGDHVEALDAYEKALDCGLKQADLESAKWLRAAIERWSNLARENKQAGRVQDAIKRWQALRDRVTVARLSPEEQKAWTEFWIDLDELLKRVQVKK